MKNATILLLLFLFSCEESNKNEISLSGISFTKSNKTIIDTIKGCKYLNEIKNGNDYNFQDEDSTTLILKSNFSYSFVNISTDIETVFEGKFKSNGSTGVSKKHIIINNKERKFLRIFFENSDTIYFPYIKAKEILFYYHVDKNELNIFYNDTHTYND